ncbi:MAG: alkaline phosphatase PhoX [Porticoccaceae bacterium]
MTRPLLSPKAAGITGFRSPDNLANGPDGRLWIVEDNVPSDIWVAEPDHDGDGKSDGVHLFASLKDDGAEGTGIYFGKDPHTLLVNVQHSATGNDKTVAITNRKRSD